MRGLRLRGGPAALLFWFAFSGVALASPSQRDQLIARWTSANATQIAAIKNAKQRAKAEAAFAKVRAGLDAPAGHAPPPADLPELANRELATPGRYHLTEKIAPPPPEPWYQRAWDWMKAQVKKLFDALFGRVRLGPGGAIAIGDLLIGGAVLVLLFVAIRLLAELQIVRRSDAASVEALGPRADARELYERAHAAARSGDFAAASRWLFAASIVALDLRGAVAGDPSATVGDLRRALRSREASLVASFDAVAAPFVASTYAERPVQSADWERARDAFLSFAPQRGPA